MMSNAATPAHIEHTQNKVAMNPHPNPSPIKREGLKYRRACVDSPSLLVWGKGLGDGGNHYRIILCTIFRRLFNA